MVDKHYRKVDKKKPGLLNEHLVFKLNEIIEFCASYSSSESFEIENLNL